jgi:hypothetical protein
MNKFLDMGGSKGYEIRALCGGKTRNRQALEARLHVVVGPSGQLHADEDRALDRPEDLDPFTGTAFVALTYLAGHAVLADYLRIPFMPGAGELSIVIGALVGAGALIYRLGRSGQGAA